MQIKNETKKAFQRVMDLIEADVRADERQRIITALGSGTTSGTGAVPATRVRQIVNDVVLCDTDYRLIAELRRGFQAVPTLAGNIGVAKKSVYHYLSRLRKAGYNVEEKPVRGRAGRYRKIFRIAS